MPELEEQVKALIGQFGAAEVRKIVLKLTGSAKRSIRKSATEYVTGLSVPAVHKDRLLALAHQFDEGTFVRSIGDIRNLFEACAVHAIPVKSRQAAIPIVFKMLATRPTDQLDRILSQGLFQAPATLAPIAEAIRETGKERRLVQSQEVPDVDDGRDQKDSEISGKGDL